MLRGWRAAWPSSKEFSPGVRAAAASRARCGSPRTLGPQDYVVALLPDTGMRYLSKVYNDEWMRERGYCGSRPCRSPRPKSSTAKRQAGKVRELVIARPYQTVFHALKTMQEQDISQIPVFEENRADRHSL